MPTYDYRCLDCENEFEISQSFKDNTLKKCPKKANAVDGCADPGKGNVKKMFGNVGISFKGSGFYKNDSRSGPSKSSESSSSSSSDSSSSSSDSSSSSSDSKKSDAKKSDAKKSDSKKSETKKSDSKKSSSSSSN